MKMGSSCIGIGRARNGRAPRKASSRWGRGRSISTVCLPNGGPDTPSRECRTRGDSICSGLDHVSAHVLGAETEADHSGGDSAKHGELFKEPHWPWRRDRRRGLENALEEMFVEKDLDA